MPQAGATHPQTHTQTHLLSLCITNTNELIDVQQKQRSRQSFPQSKTRRERKSTVVSENVCVCRCLGSCFIFSLCLTASRLPEVKAEQWSKASQTQACRSCWDPCGEVGFCLVCQQGKQTNERNY